MSGLDKLNKIVDVLKGDGGGGGLLTTFAASEFASMFSDTPFVGAVAKATAAAAAADLALRTVTGGKHSVMSVAAKTLEKAGPKFNQVIETCMGAACSAPGQESKLQAAVSSLKEHLAAGADAVANGAKTAATMATGKGATRA